MSYKNSIKRHNHKVHPCDAHRKQNLLKHLIDVHENKKILVLSKANTSTTEIEDKNLTLSNDAELSTLEEGSFDILISFDLPNDPDIYMKRLAYANTLALILVTDAEEAKLYPIETLLGKNLPRESVQGYEVLRSQKKKNPPHRPTKAQLAEEEAVKQGVRDKQDKIREWAAKRGEEASAEELKKVEDDATKFLKDSKADLKEKNSFGKKDWDKPKGDKKPWENKSNDYRGNKTSTSTTAKRAPRKIIMPTNKKG
ncbi:MAG: hypothetical protein COA44_15765 [Arcobacter sp.]|nr:MAG: hypothetical protein COA44_15765 [Arcobacter sp.]